MAVIYNPGAGKGRREKVREVVEVVRKWGQVEVLETTRRGSAVELAREAARAGVEVVLACGGDGTVNEVVNGVVGTQTAVGVLPAGTANVLAMELGIPLDPVRAAWRLPEMTARWVALGRVTCQGAEGRYFVLVCGAGVDAELMARTEALGKKRWRMAAYWLAGVGMLGKRLETLRVEGSECTLALACRVQRVGGGLRVARESHLLDETMELVLFPSRSTWRYAGYVAAAVVGRVRESRVRRRVEMEGEARVEVDGEVVGRLPAVVDVVPAAVKLLGARWTT